MITIETMIVAVSLITSLTYCLTKTLYQIEESRCSRIEMCCLHCDRSVPLDHSIASVIEPEISKIPIKPKTDLEVDL